MFKRIRRLNISLGAKCQILFGMAVALIIFSALFVPWQRMEQLTDQLNQRSANTLSEYVVNQHLAAHGWNQTAAATTAPAAQPASQPATSKPTSQPLHDEVVTLPATTAPVTPETSPFEPPRLILFSNPAEDPQLTPFDQWAGRKLIQRPGREAVFRDYDAGNGRYGFRYARFDTSCARCHASVAISTTLPATLPTTQLALANSVAAQLTTAPTATPPTLYGMVVVDIPSQIETNQLLLNNIFLLSAGLIAGTLAVIVFYLITSRLILQPVRVLQETAEKVSQGDLNIRSDISTGDEFQQLSETFNVMLANLKESADQLRAVNKSLDIKLGQLAESNLALYESNRLKTEFLANVSHELRTPLNSILGFADLLKDSSSLTSDSKASRYLQNILRSGRNLLDLINDLLDLAKIEAGRMDIRSEPLSLNDLFEALISVLKPLSETKHLSIVPFVAPDVPIIRTDPAKLQQVLYNFLSNAIKFSPANSRIELMATRRSDLRVRIAVTDYGPGIALEKHEVIFEKFRQVDASVTREHGGTGLGLAISKELSSLLSGEVGVESALGRGATFWIVIPSEIEAGAQDVAQKLVLT